MFNRWFSKGLQREYESNFKPRAENSVDLDVLTVSPASVKTQMNSGRYTGTITAAAHAKSVVDKLGWEVETVGHWVHASRDYILNYQPFKFINNFINGQRRK